MSARLAPVLFVIGPLLVFGLGFVAGCAFKQGGYWLGRMHEYDYCKASGWFNPTIRATNAHIHIDATDEQVADALIRESGRQK